jgi:hypothetical protein
MDSDRELVPSDDSDLGWRAALQPVPQAEVVKQDEASDEEHDYRGVVDVPHHGRLPDVPHSPDEYQIDVPGYEWTEDDRPNLEGFLEVAHQNGLTQRQTQNLLRWYARGAAEAQNGDVGEGGAHYSEAPESPESYELVKGKWTAADEPLLDRFFEIMHAHGASQQVIDGALTFYQELLLSQAQNVKAIDAQSRERAEAALSPHVDVEQAGSLVNAYLGDTNLFPADFRAKIKSARLPDGTRLSHDPDFVAFLIGVAKSRYAGGTSDRKGQIEAILKEDPAAYFAQGLDKEYEKILRSHRPSGPPKTAAADGKSWREREIEQILKTDPARYFRDGLDKELIELIRRREGGL